MTEQPNTQSQSSTTTTSNSSDDSSSTRNLTIAAGAGVAVVLFSLGIHTGFVLYTVLGGMIALPTGIQVLPSDKYADKTLWENMVLSVGYGIGSLLFVVGYDTGTIPYSVFGVTLIVFVVMDYDES